MYICINKYNGNIITTNTLNIDKLKIAFLPDKSFEINDIASFYKKLNPMIKKSTINWRVYSLVKMGLLNRVGRGKFIIGERKCYTPAVSSKLKLMYSKIKKEFPYLNFCLWDTSALNEFMLHQLGQFYLLVEVEKEAIDSVFFFLKERNYPVFIDPTNDILDKYLPIGKEAVIVKPLVTESPTQPVDGVMTASLEKMLVDIFCDNIIFSSHQGAEMRNIFHEAHIKYSLNQNRMLRYANRRGKKDGLRKYLNSITNLWQNKPFTADI